MPPGPVRVTSRAPSPNNLRTSASSNSRPSSAVGWVGRLWGRAPSEELFESECEILIPAAMENVITSRNADRLKARIVVEGANGPTTAVADEILTEKRIFVVPDILANAGGVTASYFEWVQDRQGYFWKEAVVNEQLETILRDSFDDVVRYAEAHNVNNRIAAYMLAIDRVSFTIKQRGIYA